MALDEKKLEEMYKIVKKSSTEMDKSAKSVDNLSSHMEDLGKEIKKTSDSFDDMNDNVSSFKNLLSKISVGKLIKETKEFTSLTGKVQELNDAYVAYQKTMVSVDKKLKIFGYDFKNISGAMQKQTAEMSGKVTKLVDQFEKMGGAQENFSKLSKAMEEVSDNPTEIRKSLSKLRKEIDQFKGSDIFEGMDDSVKKSISSVEKELDKGPEAWKSVIEKTKALDNDFITSKENLAKKNESVIKETTQTLAKLAAEHAELGDEIEKVVVIGVNTDKAQGEIGDFLNRVKEESVKLSDIIPDVEITKGKELEDRMNQIAKEHAAMGAYLVDVLKSEDNLITKKTKVVQLEREMKVLIAGQLKELNVLKDKTADYLSAVQQLTEQDFGGAKAKELGFKLTKVSALADILSQKFPKWGGEFGKVSDIAGRLSGQMTKIAIPMAVLGTVYSLSKKLLEVNQEVAKMYKGVVTAGAGIGVGLGDVNATLDDTFTKTTNVGGLFRAATWGDAFVSTREQILPVIENLTRTGKGLETIKGQLKGVETTGAATGNELLKASDMMKTFGYNLQMTDVEMSKLAGDMMYSFNSSMGDIKKNFTDITTAAQSSGMSTNRFMGIVQTTTAGLSMYSDQISDTAQMVSKLARQTNMSGQEIENFVKGAANMGQDWQKSVTVLALGMKGIEGDIKKKIEMKVTDLEVKIKDEKTNADDRKRYQSELSFQKQALEDLARGPQGLANLASYIDRLSPEVYASVVENLVNTTAAQYAGQADAFLKVDQTLRSMGITDSKMLKSIQTQIGADGKGRFEMSKADKEAAKTQEQSDKEYASLQDKAISMDQASISATNAWLGAVNDSVTDGLTWANKWLFGIFTVLTLSSLGSIGKNLKDIFKGDALKDFKEIKDLLVKRLPTSWGGGGEGFGGGKGGTPTPGGPDVGVPGGGKPSPETSKPTTWKDRVKTGTSGGKNFLKSTKIMGGIGALLAVGAAGLSYNKRAGQAEKETTDKDELSKKKKKIALEEGGGAVGTIGGAALGSFIGAGIGSIIPGIGTAIGIAVGGTIGTFIGGWLGGDVGEKIGKKVGDAMTKDDPNAKLETIAEKQTKINLKSFKQDKKYGEGFIKKQEEVKSSGEKIAEDTKKTSILNTDKVLDETKVQQDALDEKKPSTSWLPDWLIGKPSTTSLLGGKQMGGVIPQTGVYKLHAGEEVIPKKESTSTTPGRNFDVIINIYGEDVQRIKNVVKAEIENARYAR